MIDVHSQAVDSWELALASAAMLDPSFLDRVPDFSANDIRDELAALIVATAQRRRRDGLPVDMYSVVKELDRGGALAEKSGDNAVSRILALAQVPLTSDPVGLARQIHQEAQRRRLILTLEMLQTAATDPAFTTDALTRQLIDAAEGLQVATDTEFLDSVDLIEQYPDLRDPVVEGIFRRGETINIIAKSKIGKSWFGYGLGFSIAFGRDWLGRFRTQRGRVLLLDNELHRETLSSRLSAVMSAMGLRHHDSRGWFDVIALRGRSRDIHAIGRILQRIPRDKYSLIIVDAFYRLLPDGTSENDNAQMTAVYNAVDRYGDQTGAAISLIHHATKGGQSDKDVTDVGSGAGAISRAADTHLILRPHEEPGAVVLAAKTRSWQEPTPMGLRWEFPTWMPDENLDPELLKGRRMPGDERKQAADKSDCDKILNALKSGPASGRKLRSTVGIGREKLERLVGLMVHGKQILPKEETVKGNPCVVYSINPDAPERK